MAEPSCVSLEGSGAWWRPNNRQNATEDRYIVRGGVETDEMLQKTTTNVAYADAAHCERDIGKHSEF